MVKYRIVKQATSPKYIVQEWDEIMGKRWRFFSLAYTKWGAKRIIKDQVPETIWEQEDVC